MYYPKKPLFSALNDLILMAFDGATIIGITLPLCTLVLVMAYLYSQTKKNQVVKTFFMFFLMFGIVSMTGITNNLVETTDTYDTNVSLTEVQGNTSVWYGLSIFFVLAWFMIFMAYWVRDRLIDDL